VLFPSAISSSFAGLLVPEISESAASNDNERIERIVSRVLKTVLIYSIGVAGIIMCLATEFGNVTFTDKSGIKYSFYCSNNYGCNEPIQIKLLCEKGRVCFDYDNAVVTYNDGSEEKVNQNDKAESKGEKYWGNTHALQIEQFYNSCLKKERLEISAEEALKTHKIVCDIYKKANVEMMK
jgi:hypothetical protein